MRWLLAAFCLLAGSAHAAIVQVSVEGVRNDHGHVLVALCSKAEFLRPHCAWRGRAQAHDGTVIVTIDGVPPGLYAAQAFHDENDDGLLNRNILGLPNEAMGFSRDAPMRLGPPRFADAAFEVGAGTTRVAFGLKYF